MSKRASSLVKTAFLAGAVLLAGVGIVCALTIPGFGKGEKVKPVNGAVTIALAKVADGRAHYFHLNDSGKEIVFFVVRAADGSVRTAFDACDVCYREKKGYEQQGSFMLCRNCKKKFAIDRIGPHEVGGCNPSYLASRLAGDNVVISVADIKGGSRFF